MLGSGVRALEFTGLGFFLRGLEFGFRGLDFGFRAFGLEGLRVLGLGFRVHRDSTSFQHAKAPSQQGSFTLEFGNGPLLEACKVFSSLRTPRSNVGAWIMKRGVLRRRGGGIL